MQLDLVYQILPMVSSVPRRCSSTAMPYWQDAPKTMYPFRQNKQRVVTNSISAASVSKAFYDVLSTTQQIQVAGI